MANVSLTIDDITRESLRILHQKLNFCTNIITDYDDSFAQTGAKIGNTLRVRHPIQYSTGTGATMATGTGADTVQTQTTLTVSTQRHVPMRFTSAEMTMDIDSFSERHIKPAMAKLAAMVENDGLTQCVNGVNELVEAGTAVDFLDVMNARAVIQDNLAPPDDRTALLDTQANVDLVNANKSLFQDQMQLSNQYKEGQMGRFGQFDFFENTLIPSHTSGAIAGVTGANQYQINGANQNKTISATDSDPSNQTLTVDTGTATIAKGDVFTIVGVNDVHPETKADTGSLKKFTVTGGNTGTASATSITISPAIISSGPHQNVTAAPADNADLLFSGAASTAYKQSILFQKGFACMGTADLVLPPNEKASRANYDGLSIRMVQDSYDPVKDRLYTRLDILYGFKVLRPDLGCKVWHT